MWTIASIAWFVIRLRSRYDAKLQHVFHIFFWCFCAKKCQNWAWEQKKLCGNKTTISCYTTRGNLTIHFRQRCVGTHIKHCGQNFCPACLEHISYCWKFILCIGLLILQLWLLEKSKLFNSACFLSASLYVSKRSAYWDRLCRDVVGCHARALWPNGAS